MKRLAGSALLALSLPAAAQAATFQVNRFADVSDQTPGDGVCFAVAPGFNSGCTLRAAVQEANALAGTDTISLPAGNYVLTQGQLLVTSSVNVNGAGAATTVVDGDGESRVVRVNGGTVYLRYLTLTGGMEDFERAGGMWVRPGASVHLVDAVVADNQALLMGSGIHNEGYVRLLRSSVRNNINLSGFAGGGVTATGGGVHNASGSTLVVDQSAIVGNYAIRGGGIANRGTVEIRNSTISGNQASTYGGGVLNYSTSSGGQLVPGTVDIERSTIVLNTLLGNLDDGFRGGAGIANLGELSLWSTILADNDDNLTHWDDDYAPDCLEHDTGVTTTSGYNLIGTLAGCGFAADSEDQAGTPNNPLDPELGPLAPWKVGGTELHVPLAGSPAIHNGPHCVQPPLPNTPLPNCTAVDQRNYKRAGGDSAFSDVGAYETDGYPAVRGL